MENRERDRMSKRTSPTEAGDLNRDVEERKSRIKGDSAVEFGKNVGRSEDLEHEPSRRSGSMGGSIDLDRKRDSGDTGSTSGRH
jgi:hypothetical protein